MEKLAPGIGAHHSAARATLVQKVKCANKRGDMCMDEIYSPEVKCKSE